MRKPKRFYSKTERYDYGGQTLCFNIELELEENNGS